MASGVRCAGAVQVTQAMGCRGGALRGDGRRACEAASECRGSHGDSWGQLAQVAGLSGQ